MLEGSKGVTNTIVEGHYVGVSGGLRESVGGPQ